MFALRVLLLARRPARFAVVVGGLLAVTVAAGAQAPATPPSASHAASKITVTWQDADIRDVVSAFAAFSGRTIVVGPDIHADVDAEIKAQPWDVAMRAILRAHGLVATEDASGILIIEPESRHAGREATAPLATETVALNYAHALLVAEAVRPRLSRDCGVSTERLFGERGADSGAAPAAAADRRSSYDPRCPTRGAVTADSLTNSVSITETAGALPGLIRYVRSLDVRQPQVAIRAKIVLIDRTSLDAMGVKYDFGRPEQFLSGVVSRTDSAGHELPTTVALGGSILSGIANASADVPHAALTLLYSTAVGANSLTSFFQALQESSLLDVQAEPSVVTLNNRTATLTSGTQVPVRVVEAGAGAGGGTGGSFPRATVSFRQTGVVLTVTPQVTADHHVLLRIHAENSDVKLEANDVGAVFPTQSVDNELLVQDGETAVMGGLTQTTITTSRSGIPGLIAIPIVGRLFGATSHEERRRELILLITPHVLDGGPDGAR